MKLEVTQSKQFQPVLVSFTLESQAELDALGTMLNCSYIHDALEGMGLILGNVFSKLERAGADINKTDEFARLLKARTDRHANNPTNLTP